RPNSPVRRCADPTVAGKEPCLRDEAATNLPARIGGDARLVLDIRQAVSQVSEAVDAVRLVERVPCEPVRQDGEAGEKTEAGDRIERRLELEQKWRTSRQPDGPGR